MRTGSTRHNLSAGRKLAQEMDSIAVGHPTASQVAELIKMQQFVGTSRGPVWRTPSMELLATKIVVGVPSDYKVPAKLKGQLVRIPDTAVERLRETRREASQAST